MTEKYRPSNGTEGEWFMEEWCGRCQIKGICKIWPRDVLWCGRPGVSNPVGVR